MHWCYFRWPGTHNLINTQVQSAVLYYEYAVVCVSGPEKSLSLLQLYEHHVTAQLQEQGLLKVTQNPEHSNRGTRHTVLLWSGMESSSQKMVTVTFQPVAGNVRVKLKSAFRTLQKCSTSLKGCDGTHLTFFSMYRTSEGRWEFWTSYSVKSASRTEGGGSLGWRAGGSRRIRNILIG